MFEFLEPLMQNLYGRILLTLVFLAILFLILVLLRRILKNRHPLKHITNVIWKMNVKKDKVDVKTIDDAYAAVSKSLRNEGIFLKEDSGGFRSRKRVLKEMPESPKKEVLRELFFVYEAKHYGGRGINNEAKLASDILDRYVNL